MQPIHIVVIGRPVAWSRARIQKGSAHTMITPNHVRRWQDDARILARQQMADTAPLQCPVSMLVSVHLALPQGWPQWKRQAARDGVIAPVGKPDLDNYVKAVKDALNGIVYADDAQVVDLEAYKIYDDQPRVSVMVEPSGEVSSRITRKDQLDGVSKNG